jgi:mannose-6-phosphate isomerase-like protein (cupin superfamily)
LAKIKITKKPWGEERLFAKTDKYAGKILIVRKGHRLSLQYHKIKDETLYLEDGILKLTIEKGKNNLVSRSVIAGESLRVPAKTLHRIEAIENCRLIEVSTPELDDVVRVEDDYGRAKTKEGR